MVAGNPVSVQSPARKRLRHAVVAPGRRGFEWVKWVVRVEVLTSRDDGQILALYTSSFTPAGRGEIENQYVS